MIDFYFGLPRTGKTTLITKLALTQSKRYKHIYVNVHLSGMPENVIYIENEWVGKYDMSDSLILIDEGSIFADNRDYKNFSKELVHFFVLHGHYRCNIKLFAQTYNGVDKKIRTLCNNVFYMYKPFFFGRWFTKYYRIPYGIIIPDRKKNMQSTGNSLGDIEEGYCKPSLLIRLFCRRFYRPRYYKYFDSWEAPVLPPVPSSVPPVPPVTIDIE